MLLDDVCPFCARTWPESASVCAGCGAELIRGATPSELETALKWGAFAGFFGYIGLLNELRGYISFGVWAAVVTTGLGALLGGALASIVNRNEARYFRTARRY